MASRKARPTSMADYGQMAPPDRVGYDAAALASALTSLARAMKKAGVGEYEHPSVGRIVLAKVESRAEVRQTTSGPRPRPETPEDILFGATEGLPSPIDE